MNNLVEGTDEMVTRFCYRVEPGAGMAQDEDGNNAECYMEFKLTHTKEIPLERFKHMHEESLKKRFFWPTRHQRRLFNSNY